MDGQAKDQTGTRLPHLDRIVLYEQQIEILTGKHSEGLYH